MASLHRARSVPLVPSSAVAAVGLAVLAGCASSRPAWLEPRAGHEPGLPRSAAEVEVWLDEAPRRPFLVVGDLSARSADSPASIRKMRERAASAGADGIYWITCASACSGACSARAFVYTPAATPGPPSSGREAVAVR